MAEERRREPSQQEWDRAVFYAQNWIIPLLQAEEPGELSRLIRELAEQTHEIPHSRRHKVSETTLWRMLSHYQAQGMEGLCRKPRNDAGRARVLPPHILQRAIEIRQDLPSRSVQRILKVLQKEFPLEMDQVKYWTLSHAMTAAGCPRVKPGARSPGPRKERHIRMLWPFPLDLVQSDVCGKTLWVTEQGKVYKASLMGVLDHCSKLCLHGEWFLAANLPALEKCVVLALLAYGLFKRLHVDNGAIYVSYLLANICADMGIELKLTRPGYAPGKGGIERFWLTVEEDFMREVGDSTRLSLAQLNAKYRAWQHEYNHRTHSATGEPPVERYQRLVGEVRFPDPARLYRASLLREKRKVDKRHCTVQVRCLNFAVHASLRDKWVQVRYDPFLLTEVLVYDETGSRFLQKAFPESANAQPAPFLPEEPAHPTPRIDVLADLEAEHAQFLASQQGKPASPGRGKGGRFAAFCQQVGRILQRETTLTSSELTRLREQWDQYGPFAAGMVRQVLESMVGQVGAGLHLEEYLQALVRARLEQEREDDN